MAITFESMSNSILIFIFLLLTGAFTINYLELNKTMELKKCYSEIDMVEECIYDAYFSESCSTKLNEKIEIKNNYIFCKEAYFRSRKNVSDIIIASKEIICNKQGEVVECMGI